MDSWEAHVFSLYKFTLFLPSFLIGACIKHHSWIFKMKGSGHSLILVSGEVQQTPAFTTDPLVMEELGTILLHSEADS